MICPMSLLCGAGYMAVWIFGTVVLQSFFGCFHTARSKMQYAAVKLEILSGSVNVPAAPERSLCK